MPQIERAILAGYRHHVTQRVNRRQPVFEDAVDLLRRLKQNTHAG